MLVHVTIYQDCFVISTKNASTILCFYQLVLYRKNYCRVKDVVCGRLFISLNFSTKLYLLKTIHENRLIIQCYNFRYLNWISCWQPGKCKFNIVYLKFTSSVSMDGQSTSIFNCIRLNQGRASLCEIVFLFFFYLNDCFFCYT